MTGFYKSSVHLSREVYTFNQILHKMFLLSYCLMVQMNGQLFARVLKRKNVTAHKMKFSIKDFFSKCDQIRNFLRIWLHLLKKSLMENFIFLCSA